MSAVKPSTAEGQKIMEEDAFFVVRIAWDYFHGDFPQGAYTYSYRG